MIQPMLRRAPRAPRLIGGPNRGLGLAAWLWLINFFLMGSLAAGSLSQQSPTIASNTPITLDEVIDTLQRKYSALAGFSADFQQSYTSAVASVQREESGVLYMRKPGRMRWEYQKPETKLFVSDGKKSYFYVPSDRQVTVHNYTPDDIQSVPILFLLGQGDIRRDFVVTWETMERKRHGENYFIRLRPKASNTIFTAVLIEIHRTDFTIERLIIIDSSDDRSEFVLSHFNPAAKLDDELFKFKIPKGVDVLSADVR